MTALTAVAALARSLMRSRPAGRSCSSISSWFPPTTARCLRSASFGGYLTARAQQQATWHRDKVGDHLRKARTLRLAQLAAAGIGVVLAAVAGVLPGSHLAA